MPLSPHQVSFQSRLLEESLSLLLLERIEFFDEDEIELTLELDVWFFEALLVSHGIMRGNRDVFALLGESGPGLACPGCCGRPSTTPGGFQCAAGLQPRRLWRSEDGVPGREGIFDFGAVLSSGLGVLRAEGAGLAAAICRLGIWDCTAIIAVVSDSMDVCIFDTSQSFHQVREYVNEAGMQFALLI